MFKINSASHSLSSRVGSAQSWQNTRLQNGLSGGSASGLGAQSQKSQQARGAGATGSAMADRNLDKGEFGNALSNLRGAYTGFRQARQDARIQKGLQAGTVDSSEAKHLAGQQSRIAEAKASAMADGKMDASEFRNIQKLQREASRDIFIAKHNGGSLCDKPAPSSGGTTTQPVPSSGGTTTQPAPSSGGTTTQPAPSSGGTAAQPAPSVTMNVLNFLVNVVG
jgi:hypothetical protein